MGAVSIYAKLLSEGRYLWQCRACDWTYVNDGFDVAHVCGRGQVTRTGDVVKLALMGVGITEERATAVLKAIGLPGCGGCKRRQRWLNALDERLGLGEKMLQFKAAMGWKTTEAKDGHSARTQEQPAS